MRKLGNSIDYLIAGLSGDSDAARINLRARQVRSRFRKAIETVYLDSAELFLDHTNNVYIMKKNGVNTLIVYVDESIFAAELNAQRELIKLKLLELFGEQIEEFEISVSKPKYKNNHPYREEKKDLEKEPSPLVPLTDSEKDNVEQVAALVEDEKLRKSFEKAMTADMSRKKSENGV